MSERMAVSLSYPPAEGHPLMGFPALFEESAAPMWLAGDDGRIEVANPAAGALLGYAVRDLEGRSAAELFEVPGEHDRLTRVVERGGSIEGFEATLLRRTGSRVHCVLAASAARRVDGRRRGYLAVAVDISDRRALEERLQHNALHDSLTGLPNRALFKDRLEQSVRRLSRRRDYAFAVLFLDLDRFKVVNDSLGHLLGDELLILVATRLKGLLRDVDTVARLGGDEFAILLDEVEGTGSVRHVADRIQEAFRAPLYPAGTEVYTSTSIGIALSTPAYESPDEVLRDADIAMYRAKEVGRGRIEFFDESMRSEVAALLQLETDLARALTRHEFEVHYQPILEVGTGRLAGFESLLRWRHPERGLLLPGEFLGVAEDSGMIVPIGWWMFAAACRQLRQWQEAWPLPQRLRMSINFSGRQLLQPDTVDRVRGILDYERLDGEGLSLEVTEHAIMTDSEATVTKLQALKALGLGLSIDDFGTGYSSLGYLHRFPFDTVKIDRSFIAELDQSGNNPELVWSIVALAHNLGMKIVAEGVETEQQMEELRALKCEFVQGNLFSPALDTSAAGEYVAAAARNPAVSKAAGPSGNAEGKEVVG